MFKEKFKFFKSRCPPPTFEAVVDFHQLKENNFEKIIQRNPRIPGTGGKQQFTKHHLIDVEHWKIYELKDKPGLLFIVNPFTTQGQQYWVEKCLTEYTKKPNKLNLDPFDDLKPGENWWEKAHILNEDESRRLLMKLRWATLGYHHNWDTKEYSDTDRSEFPVELAELSKIIVQVVDEAYKNFRAEAAIVNFYHFDSTLSGHKDVSEPNMDAPLLSISFGQSAVFLVGGPTQDDAPTAMFIHSGDVVVMSGAARGCYHGVPRVLTAPGRPWAGDSWEATPCGRYLDTNRINLNIRQVLRPGEDCIKR